MFFFFNDTTEKLETPFLSYTDILSNESPFFFFHIDLKNDEQKALLDSYFVSICEGMLESNDFLPIQSGDFLPPNWST